jgi:tetratricopeptide (TPR) repeat protein
MKLTSIAVLLILPLSFPAVAQTQPLTAASELQQGVDAYNKIHYEEAIDHLEKAIELDPNLVNASLYLSAARAGRETQLGVEAYNNIHYEEAIEHLQRAIESDPSLVDARFYLATIFAHQFIPGANTPNNETLAQQAIDQYQQVIDANPPRAQKINSARGIAYLYVNMKRFDDAKRYYRLAVDSDANDPQLYYGIGVIDWTACYKLRTEERAKLELKPEEHLNALNDGQKKVCEDLTLKNWANIQEGIDSLNMAIQLRPDYGDAMGYLNLMYRERADVECDDLAARAQDLRMADHWVNESVRVKKSNADKPPNAIARNLIETGQHYFDEGNYSEAVVHYSKAIEIDPRSGRAYYQLGESYLKLHDTQRAYEALNQAVEFAPDNYRARTDLANLLVGARRPDGTGFPEYITQAKPHLDFLKEKQPNNPETHQAWASYYEAQNKIGEAIQEAQQTISLDPNRAESYLLLALLQIRANQPDQAEANFKKAIAVDAKSLNAVLALGAFYQSHNRLPEAEQQFRQAIV